MYQGACKQEISIQKHGHGHGHGHVQKPSLRFSRLALFVNESKALSRFQPKLRANLQVGLVKGKNEGDDYSNQGCCHE